MTWLDGVVEALRIVDDESENVRRDVEALLQAHGALYDHAEGDDAGESLRRLTAAVAALRREVRRAE